MASRIEPSRPWYDNCNKMYALYDSSIRFHRKIDVDVIEPIIAKGNLFENIEAVY